MAAEPDPVTFDEAIAFLRRKTNVTTSAWRDLDGEMHARAFTVAGLRHEAALIAVREAVDRALAEGGTLGQFRQDLRGILERAGVTLRGPFGWRSRVILETNLRTAYHAGRWEQAQRLRESRPYLRYTAVLDNLTRPQHRAWHGVILPVEHEFWRTHYPPNGWGCRCTVVSLSARDLARRGWRVTDPPPPSGRLPRSVRGADGNRIVELPPGIDEGWDYNVGEAAARWRALMPVAPDGGPVLDASAVLPAEAADAVLRAAVASEPLPPPRAVPAAAVLPARLARDAYVRAFLAELGATPDRPAALADPAGLQLVVGADLFRRPDGRLAPLPAGPRRWLRLAGRGLREPDEIWAAIEAEPGPAQPRYRLVRRYLARWRVDADTVVTLVEWARGGRGWRVLMAGGDEGQALAERARRGQRLYRRED